MRGGQGAGAEQRSGVARGVPRPARAGNRHTPANGVVLVEAGPRPEAEVGDGRAATGTGARVAAGERAQITGKGMAGRDTPAPGSPRVTAPRRRTGSTIATRTATGPSVRPLGQGPTVTATGTVAIGTAAAATATVGAATATVGATGMRASVVGRMSGPALPSANRWHVRRNSMTNPIPGGLAVATMTCSQWAAAVVLYPERGHMVTMWGGTGWISGTSAPRLVGRQTTGGLPRPYAGHQRVCGARGVRQRRSAAGRGRLRAAGRSRRGRRPGQATWEPSEESGRALLWVVVAVLLWAVVAVAVLEQEEGSRRSAAPRASAVGRAHALAARPSLSASRQVGTDRVWWVNKPVTRRQVGTRDGEARSTAVQDVRMSRAVVGRTGRRLFGVCPRGHSCRQAMRGRLRESDGGRPDLTGGSEALSSPSIPLCFLCALRRDRGGCGCGVGVFLTVSKEHESKQSRQQKK
eukprot:Hpha_TRINITY_DN34023_c0_g1::TRINITY_DN34023_c0_g1_i1::g.30499::m.30499